MIEKKQSNYRDVTAIVTAMTDGEKTFLFETVKAVLADPDISQVILCIEEKNTWINTVLGVFMEDARLQVVRMPMAFLGAVRNHALNYVKTPWVAFCDGDDIWCEGKVYAQRLWADITNSDFVGADHCLINETGRMCAFALARNIPMPSSWLVRTEVIKQYLFNDSLPSAEDGEWWVRTKDIVHKARCPKILLKYRVRSGSLSSHTSSKRRKAQIVNLASMPLIREIILLLTWSVWLVTRQKEYIWLKAWGQEPCLTSNDRNRV